MNRSFRNKVYLTMILVLWFGILGMTAIERTFDRKDFVIARSSYISRGYYGQVVPEARRANWPGGKTRNPDVVSGKR